MNFHIMEFHRRCYSNQLVSDRYAMPDCFIKPGHLCCVKISEDKWWYRVIIHRVLGKQEVEVFYPDFGNIGTVQKSSLRFLKWVKFNKNNLSYEKHSGVRIFLPFLSPSSLCPSLLSIPLLSADFANGHLVSQLEHDLLCLSHERSYSNWMWTEWAMRLNFSFLLRKCLFGSC